MGIAIAARRHDSAQRLVLLAAVGAVVCSCARGGITNTNELLYAHGRIHVDKETAVRWEANEREIAAEGERIQSIPADDKHSSTVPFPDDARARLTSLKPSERHGAADKRMLSVLGDRKNFQSSGVVAEITLVKGSEYKSEANFRKGWLPVAIVVLPDTFPSGTVAYPKLGLHGGTSWIYVREESASKWEASLVRLVGGKVEQQPMNITIAMEDKVEPVIGARFNWEDDDESIWVYCGGKCCKLPAPR
jgi:hypothetical protein